MLLRAPFPPTGGVCSVSNSTLLAIAENLVISCEEWRAESLPLQFRFGYSEAPWSSNPVAWATPTHSSRYNMRLAEGSYVVGVEIIDAFGGATLSNLMPVSVEAVLPASASDDEALAFLDNAFTSLDRLGQTSQILGAATSVMKQLNRETQPGSGRRLLASSAAYRMRVRRMLLQNMQGSVNSSMTPRSTGPVLSTTEGLASAGGIQDVQPGTGMQAAASLERASSLAVQKKGFGEEDLEGVLRVSDAVLFASRMEDNRDARNVAIRGVLSAIEKVSEGYVRVMLQKEQPLVC
eukprot:2469525-Rhodomonas_salina.1